MKYIKKALSQYSLAQGNCDMVFTRCLMSDNTIKIFEDGDEELEKYFEVNP